MSPARAAALSAYVTVAEGTATLPDALAIAHAALSDPRDRALAAEILTGAFRWRAALDHALAARLRRPLDRLDPIVLGILRLSAYQLLFLDRVPAHAVVHDAVTLTREAKKSSATGLVNAVLRRLAEADRATLWPPSPLATGSSPIARASRNGRSDPALEYLATTMSHPRWLVTRWLDRYGFEATETWVRFDNAAAPLTLRANRLQITRDGLRVRLAEHGVVAEPTVFAPDGLIVREGHALQTPLAGQGLFMTQDEASQLVACVAAAAMPDTRRPLRVLDACASPGGKTVALASGIGEAGLIVASDRRRRRLRLLRDTIAAAGATRVRLAQIDLEAGLPFADLFDLVLVDAPCSGLGTIRREPEIRWRRSEEELARFADLQQRMLHHAARTVRPGGRLVYATCSSEPEENEAVAAAFLIAHPTFRALPGHDLPLSSGVRQVIDASGHLRTTPFEHGLEAFFSAAFERRDEAGRLVRR
jgi:16S rRNA (cytosine967-C5)-methyltransferase